MFTALYRNLRLRWRRRVFREGKHLTQFLAPDIRRDIQVIDTAELADGLVTVRVRTWNVLYAVNNIVDKPDFGEPVRQQVDSLWNWSGAPWGGPVPEQSDDPQH